MNIRSKKIIPIISTLYLLIIFTTLFCYKSGFNFVINFEDYNLFHLITETLVSVIAASIFLLIHYSYPYEKNTKYFISGSLFLTTSLLNTYHIYSISNETFHYRIIAANMCYFVFAMTFILLSSLPNKKLTLKRWVTLIIPIVMTAICIIWLKFDNKLSKTLFITGEGITPDQFAFNIFLGFFYIVALILITIQYLKDQTDEAISLLNGILYFILVWMFSFLYKYQNDIYSIALHIAKLGAIIFIFKGYFVSSIKRPYEKLNEARKFAEEASNIKTDFIVNLSHELRTPVNIIINAIRVLEQDNDISNKYANAIEKNALRLNKLCESILNFNEIENDLVEITESETDVVYLIDEILEEAEPVADEKNLDIKFDFSNVEIIVTDSEKLKIILLNLLSNAFKYATREGYVRILLNIHDMLELTILNNGPNIPKSEIDKVFQKFYKTKDKNLESTEGLGIGLYISKKYAELLGGTISIINHDDFTGYKLLLPIKKSGKVSYTSPEYNIRGFFSDLN